MYIQMSFLYFLKHVAFFEVLTRILIELVEILKIIILIIFLDLTNEHIIFRNFVSLEIKKKSVRYIIIRISHIGTTEAS